MIVKIVFLFLIAMGVMAMFGRLRMPRLGKPPKLTRLSGRKCPDCGAPRIGAGPCPCGAGRK